MQVLSCIVLITVCGVLTDSYRFRGPCCKSADGSCYDNHFRQCRKYKKRLWDLFTPLYYCDSMKTHTIAVVYLHFITAPKGVEARCIFWLRCMWCWYSSQPGPLKCRKCVWLWNPLLPTVPPLPSAPNHIVWYPYLFRSLPPFSPAKHFLRSRLTGWKKLWRRADTWLKRI